MSGIDLILAARKVTPQLPVIVMTAFKTADVQRLAGGSSIEFLEKPFAFDRFVQLVDQALVAQQRVGFSGAISVQTLPDIVQLYVLSNATGMLSVRHHSGEGSLYFSQGGITHAETGEGEGENAFFEIMGWSGGDFSMKVGATAPRKSISANWQELLMESCRLLDERKRESEGRMPSRAGWTLAPPADNELDDAFRDMELQPAPAPPAPPPTPTLEHDTPLEELRMNIKDSLGKLNQIDGFVGACLVDSESGMLLGQEGGGTLNLEVAAAGNTEVVRAKRKTMGSLNLKDQIEDMLITLGKQYHMIRPLRGRPTLFFYVALERSKANLAMARIALADVEKDLQV
jgi:hypothetical protein